MSKTTMADDLHKDIEKVATQLEELKRTSRLQMDSSQLAHLRPPGPLVRAVDASWVHPHQPIAWPHWPPGVWPKAVAALQKVTRRLLRWYINPLVEEQNVFNAAVLQSLEHLNKEIVSLRLQLERGEKAFSQSTAGGSLQAIPPQRRLAEVLTTYIGENGREISELAQEVRRLNSLLADMSNASES